MQTLSFPHGCTRKHRVERPGAFLCCSACRWALPAPPSRSPPPRWGSGECARYGPAAAGTGAARSKPSNLTEAAKKSRVRGENAANATKPMLFCCVGKGSNKKVLEDPFPKQQMAVLCPVCSILETGTLLSSNLCPDSTTRRPKRQPEVYASCGFLGNFCIRSRSAKA